MFTVPQTSGSNATTTVKVYARTRPLLQNERDQGATSIVTVVPADKQVIVEDSVEKSFKFENVFGEFATQEEVYQNMVSPLVRKVLEGQKVTVLAYGQTGSGKTFTMGTDPCTAKDDEGILQRAIYAILSKDTQDENCPPNQVNLTISFLEVYNEAIYDLLATSRVPLKTKAEYGGAISAIGLVEEKICSVEEGLKLLERGSLQRIVASTALNQHSSRSHALIYLRSQNGASKGCLILVDLAGAEGVGRAQTSGQQFTEGIHINKGLLTLGKVLSSLSDPGHKYVPFRESILTRLLKDSLEGNRHTAMIACLNPANFNIHETINTLRYAEQAQHIRMKPQAFSTIKRSGIKRRCEDVTATPGAWKRWAMTSTKKKDHNTTVSTPGHKPPAKRALPVFNITFATPSSRVSDVTTLIPLSTQKPEPLLSSFSQPIFEDDSPSRFSVISAVDDVDSKPHHFSPYIERITNRIELSMMTHLESIEDRVADRIISRLKNKKGKKSRKSSVKRMNSSTPDNENKSSRTDSSSDDSFSSVASALLAGKGGKRVFTKLITEVLRDVQNQTMSTGIEPNTQRPLKNEKECKVRQPFSDLSNVTQNNRGEMKNINVSNIQTGFTDHPVTSTAFNVRHVRKSTRLSTRTSINNAIFSKVSPLLGKDCTSPLLFSDQDNITVVFSDASPMLPSRPSIQNVNFEETVIFKNTFELPPNNQPSYTDKNDISLSSTLQIDRVCPKRASVRRSTRVSAIRATQRNFEILTGRSPGTALCSEHNCTSVLNTTKVSTRNVKLQTQDANINMNKTKNLDASKILKLVMSPKRQKSNYEEILDLLNTGTVRKLQQLPTIGPKTAMIIYNFRQTYGELKSVEDISNIPALPKSFCTRFFNANLMYMLPSAKTSP